jgi:hypothetical protein
MPGVRGGPMGGSRFRTPSQAQVALRRASKGKPESGGESTKVGSEGGTLSGNREDASGRSVPLPRMEGTRAVNANGLGVAPASGPVP